MHIAMGKIAGEGDKCARTVKSNVSSVRQNISLERNNAALLSQFSLVHLFPQEDETLKLVYQTSFLWVKVTEK